MDANTPSVLSAFILSFGRLYGYTAEIDQTFRGNMEMCSADN